MTKREEYKKFCFIYGSQHVEKLFGSFTGYQQIRTEHSYKTVTEETETYFNEF
jgi:hypothetical protein